jgi:4-amino-4-deoxy-L-arabinose transferase-like glycosyltransferase
MMSSFTEINKSLLARWSSRDSYWLLMGITLLCLLPFSGRAFHVDDPLFVWSGQQIAQHPLDPYGFQVVWDNYSEPMSEITKNPPLACYYAAAVGLIAGWSERALHLGFLLPAVALVLGTYRLSMRFTRLPLVATAAALLTPGVLVSASSVMCDVMMLAFWIWAAVLWMEGLDDGKRSYLIASTLLLTFAALTKYFGICLLPLLLVYSVARKRQLGLWALYFLVPLVLLAAYQMWTTVLYGHAMFSDAFNFAHVEQAVNGKPSFLTEAFVGASFVGGCTLSALFFSTFLWSWKKLSVALVVSAICALMLARGWVGLGHYDVVVRECFRSGWIAPGIQLTIAIFTGVIVFLLGIAELRQWRNADSLFLGLWLIGTCIFAGFLNWSVNGRSVLPLIPAAGILLARRLDKLNSDSTRGHQRKVALALALSGVMSLWVTKADSDWANSARQASQIIQQQIDKGTHAVWFTGHWGFQYYVQLWGARPMDFIRSDTSAGDVLIVPESNAVSYVLPSPQVVASSGLLRINLQQPLSTMRWREGAGFYSSFYGFLPFAFGRPATEQYYVLHLASHWDAHIKRTAQN